jgi:hypothetical protein
MVDSDSLDQRSELIERHNLPFLGHQTLREPRQQHTERLP